MPCSSYDPLQNAQRSGYTRLGFAERYDAYRPRPPEALLEALLQVAQTPCPTLVVDLGSGTGLSSAVWLPRARQVVGIEPLAAMRQQALASYHAPQLHFQDGSAQQTALPTASADIVTCSQSLHWMEPESTLAEVARLLRPGGVFAAYDYDLPPTIHWEAEHAFLTFLARIRQLRSAYAVPPGIEEWAKHDHLERLRASGHFRYVKELLFHHREPCTAERFVGFALTLREVMSVLDLGVEEAETGLRQFREVVDQALGTGELPWYVSYRVRVGVK